MRFVMSLIPCLSVVTMTLWNLQVDCLPLPRGTKAAIRFDRFEWVVNNTFGVVNDIYVTQFNGFDFANVAMTFNDVSVLQKLSFEIMKCKEHYIDCTNYRTFEITRLCGKEKSILFFTKIGYVNREWSCQIDKGRYVFKNATLDADNIVASFALSSDKWWENSWKWNCVFFSHGDAFVMRSNGQLRFLLLSRQTHSRH
ncbi:uncharacterized protein LOC126898467 [Daktulosphaira vitifoliae]|uniref:uncharacterized protein LOC126898467 n=1 Tax=Daktulosphaira vitifoliae TaxID=58002 RepID=UPI0021A9CB91|nr:uncharacterized protein LOC126898467 [Daktulosphaira vitifoliae]